MAVGLTVLWAVGGGIVLIAYRPGGPVDLLVGVAASLPLFVSVAPVVWPPLVRSNRGSAGVFWLGLLAGLLLMPSIAGVAAQVVQGGTEPLLPSFEATYSWAVALLATSLFAGLGISRQFVPEVGIGRKRIAAAVGFAVVATSLIGGTFAGVSGADNAALNNMPAPNSRFGPAGDGLNGSKAALNVPANCRDTIASPTTASLQLDLSANVDSSAVGTVSLSGNRSGSDVSWSDRVVRSDLFGQYSTVRVGSRAWTFSPEGGWQTASPATVDTQMIDLTVLTNALLTDNRATAEDWGLEYVEGARARHCRVAVDGATFAASFPQVTWLTGTAPLQTWRGELDFWIFGDNEVGMVSGSVNGGAEAILPHGLLATVRVKLTVTDRDQPVTISPPRT